MDGWKKLQREVVSGLDDLQQLVRQEQERQAFQPPPATERTVNQKEEVSKLKEQMEDLHQRFNDLCARIEAGEDTKIPASRAEIGSEKEPMDKAQTARPRPARRFEGPALNLLEEEIRSAQLKTSRQAHLRRAAAGAVLLASLLAVWLGFGHLYSGVGQVEIESEPANADLYIDDQFQGQTPLQLKSIRAGSYRIRIAKEGYEPLAQELRLRKGETARLDVRLKELSAAQLQGLARSLFDQGKLREADRICTLLFQKPPYDAFALELKEKILTRLLEQISQEGLPDKSLGSEPVSQQAWKSSELKRAESDRPKERLSDKAPRSEDRRFSENEKVTAAEPSKPTRAPSNSAQPAVALQRPFESSRLVASENSVRAREPVSRTVTVGADQRPPDPINTEFLERIKSRIQSKNFNEARALLLQLPATSQPVVELKNLMALAETDFQKQQQLVSSELQKAESALVVGHYIIPPEDNVVIHCNRGLSFDPQNQRLLALKKDVINRSITQARDWIQRGKFDQARLFYSSLNYLSQNDTGFPVRRQWIQEEIDKLEFTAYPVMHEHRFGSCNGKLRMNAHVLSFVVSGDSSHGFTEPLRKVMVTEAGETLKVRLDDKTYQFQPNSNKESPSSREGFRAVYEQLMSLVAKAAN